MAITFGLMFHMDRAPATPVVPVQQPVIQATVVPEVSRPILPVESSVQSQFNMMREKPTQLSTFQAYDLHGERRTAAPEPGTMLDIFA